MLNFNENEVKAILSILAAIYHLGNAGAIKQQTTATTSFLNRGQFQNQNEAYKAAHLLGVSYEQLVESVFTLRNTNAFSGSGGGGSNSSKYHHLTASTATSSHTSPDQYAAYQHNLSPLECLYGFVIGLYQECLNLLTNCINRTFKTHNQTSTCSLLIVDPPGFQTSTKNAANYADLISNYVAERLQLLFYQLNFINPIEKYTQEGLDIDLVEHIPESPSALVNWLDKPPHMVRNNNSNQSTSSIDSQSSLGLLWLLEEELLADSKTSNNFIRKMIESDRKQIYFSITEPLTTTTTTNGASGGVNSTHHETNNITNFTIYHQFGQSPVEYNSSKWLQTCKDYLTIRNALLVLQESKRDAILESFTNTTFNTYTDIGTGSSLKRQASVRKMLTMSKKKTFTINLKLQLDSLFDSLRRTKANFVFCMQPYTSSTPIPTAKTNSPTSIVTDINSLFNNLDVPLLRSQLKSYQILAACRIYRQGFPDCLNYDEFKRRYSMLCGLQTICDSNLTDSKQMCSHLIKSLDILDLTQYKFGLNQIFFKAGVLNKLEDQREEKINDLIKRLQSYCRMHLARKAYERKKIETAAIKCIQKNIRIHFVLKTWHWWKLYTNLKPLVNVQNNEVLVKQYKEELDDIKRKFERLLNEKNDLKLINNQLENKLMNLQTEYVEEHAANAGTMDLLEVETSERMRVERDLNELRPLYNDALKKIEIYEAELLEYRLNHATSSVSNVAHSTSTALNDVQNDDTDGLTSSNQYDNKLKRDYEYLKQQLKQDKENLIEQNEKLKLNYELKLKDINQTNDNLESQLAIYKRKYQKLQEEMQDLQRFNDEYKSRNRELERIQSKFDADMHDLKQELDKEIIQREKCQREKDQMQYELYQIKSDKENFKVELDFQKEKFARLEKDLKEYEMTINTSLSNGSLAASSDSGASSNGGTGGGGSLQQQLIKLKSQIREMEMKIRDQEEELDDQAATIQQLEQFKLKLEMQLEKEKQKWQREIAEKESEMDDLRFHTQKKIKSIEIQFEEESEVNSNLQREKRELERKLREYENNLVKLNGHTVVNSNDYEYISKLKRQLHKYKALAIDAQTQLEKVKDLNAPKQSAIMKTLKLQLEDSEICKINALKAKQLMQNDIDELQQQLEEALQIKQHTEEINIRLQHEINELKSQLDDQERECEDLLKKYQNHIQNYTIDSNRFIDLNNQIDLLNIENRIIKEKLRDYEEKINIYETQWIDKSYVNKFESKIRELECKCDLEQTHKVRLQAQLERMKQAYDKCLTDCEQLANREKKSEDGLKRINRHNKETQEEISEMRKKMTDFEETKKRLVSVKI